MGGVSLLALGLLAYQPAHASDWHNAIAFDRTAKTLTVKVVEHGSFHAGEASFNDPSKQPFLWRPATRTPDELSKQHLLWSAHDNKLLYRRPLSAGHPMKESKTERDLDYRPHVDDGYEYAGFKLSTSKIEELESPVPPKSEEKQPYVAQLRPKRSEEASKVSVKDLYKRFRQKRGHSLSSLLELPRSDSWGVVHGTEVEQHWPELRDLERVDEKETTKPAQRLTLTFVPVHPHIKDLKTALARSAALPPHQQVVHSPQTPQHKSSDQNLETEVPAADKQTAAQQRSAKTKTMIAEQIAMAKAATDTENVRLQSKVDELTKQLEDAHADRYIQNKRLHRAQEQDTHANPHDDVEEEDDILSFLETSTNSNERLFNFADWSSLRQDLAADFDPPKASKQEIENQKASRANSASFVQLPHSESKVEAPKVAPGSKSEDTKAPASTQPVSTKATRKGTDKELPKLAAPANADTSKQERQKEEKVSIAVSATYPEFAMDAEAIYMRVGGPESSKYRIFKPEVKESALIAAKPAKEVKVSDSKHKPMIFVDGPKPKDAK